MHGLGRRPGARRSVQNGWHTYQGPWWRRGCCQARHGPGGAPTWRTTLAWGPEGWYQHVCKPPTSPQQSSATPRCESASATWYICTFLTYFRSLEPNCLRIKPAWWNLLARVSCQTSAGCSTISSQSLNLPACVGEDWGVRRIQMALSLSLYI